MVERRRAVVLACVVGLVVRLGWCAFAARRPELPGDPFAYITHAEDLASGRGYATFFFGDPSAYYPPGYPGLLGALLWTARLAHDSTTPFGVTIFVNLAAGVATVALTHAAARRLVGERPAAIAAFAVALWPGLVLYSATAHLESVFTALVALIALLLARLGEARRAPSTELAVLGAVLGAAVLVRPLIAPAALLVALLARRRGWVPALRDLAVVSVAAAAVVLPWSVRSSIALDTVVLVSTNTGDNLCVGHSPFSDGGYHHLTTTCWRGYGDVDREELEVEHDRRGTSRAIRYAVEHPAREGSLLVRKAWRMVEHDHEGLLAVESSRDDRFLAGWLRSLVRVGADFWWLASWPFVIGGGVLLWRTARPGPRAVLLLGGLLLVVPLVFFGNARFHVPATPVFAICVGAAVDALVRRPSKRVGYSSSSMTAATNWEL